jgi:hypothetical protein
VYGTDCYSEGNGDDRNATTIEVVQFDEQHKAVKNEPEAPQNSSTDAQTSGQFNATDFANELDDESRRTQRITIPSMSTPNTDNNVAVTDREETDTNKTTSQSRSARNVPPHLRPDFPSPATRQANVHRVSEWTRLKCVIG